MTEQQPASHHNVLDASELVETLLSNEHIPPDVREKFWVFFGRSLKLSFFNLEDVQRLMFEFELMRLTIIESMPKRNLDEGVEMLLNSLRIEFFANVKRSQGLRLNTIELITASTTATFSEQPIKSTAQESSGWGTRLMKGISNLGK
jgi:hypothetical protein